MVLTMGFVGYSAADPLGTAFMYQGRLVDANQSADGLYDFEFKVYDANVAGTQKGSTIDVNECDVIDGYFTVSLNFGSGIFDGNDRWLEIGVRPGEPNVYTILTPRQQITPAPYALYAASGTQGPQGPIGMTGPQGLPGDSHWLLNGTATYYNTGNVGIGTNNPQRILHIVGANPRILIEASSISPEINFKNTGDSTSETWSLYKDGGTDDLRFYQNGNRVTIQNSTGNVGIDTIYPWSKLSVGGPGYGYTGIYGEGDDYGIYGFSDSGVGVSGINNSTYNEGMLGGDDYGVKSEGDLVVTGAYRGDIGPNKGAPFPRPAYDSGWQGISDGETKTLTHNIGGDPDNYVVDLTMKGQTGTGVTNRGIGADVYYESQFLNKGFFWKELTDSQIKVHREEQDLIAGTMRIRIWVYN